ncbi:hypothetical protein DBV15_10855, partial [Temnothorax longispinosus]
TLRDGIAKYEIVTKRLRAENRNQITQYCRFGFFSYFAIPSRNVMFLVSSEVRQFLS